MYYRKWSCKLSYVMNPGTRCLEFHWMRVCTIELPFPGSLSSHARQARCLRTSFYLQMDFFGLWVWAWSRGPRFGFFARKILQVLPDSPRMQFPAASRPLRLQTNSAAHWKFPSPCIRGSDARESTGFAFLPHISTSRELACIAAAWEALSKGPFGTSQGCGTAP